MKRGVDISIVLNEKPLWDWLPLFHLANGWLMFYWLRLHIGVSVRLWQ